ncbi:DUF2953 domain-containing protein [Effusibacillus dendaii]|nr:DUF2953 domain-containing protein [Effusibacillus dendaii]
MNWLWTVLIGLAAALLLLFLLLLLIPLQVHIQYSRNGRDDQLTVQFQALFGLFTYKIESSAVDLIVSLKEKSKIKANGNTDARVAGQSTETAESAEAIESSQPTRLAETVSQDGKHAVDLPFERLQKSFQIYRELTEHLHTFHQKLRQLTKVFRVVEMNWKTDLGTGDAALTGMATGVVWGLKGTLLGIISGLFSFRSQPHLSVYPHFNKELLRTEVDCIIRFWLGQAIVAGIQMGIYMLREGKKSWRIIRSKV